MKGHMDHKERLEHEGRHKRARGGAADQEETNRKNGGDMMHEHAQDGEERGHHKIAQTRKKGGRAEEVEKKRKEHEKLKKGGIVKGEKPKHRLDKRARGGATGSPEHPLSGADAPNLPYAHGDLKAGSEGMGKDCDRD